MTEQEQQARWDSFKGIPVSWQGVAHLVFLTGVILLAGLAWLIAVIGLTACGEVGCRDLPVTIIGLIIVGIAFCWGLLVLARSYTIAWRGYRFNRWVKHAKSGTCKGCEMRLRFMLALESKSVSIQEVTINLKKE